MDLLAIGTCVPAVTARGAIVEKGQKRRKAIGDYLNNQRLDDAERRWMHSHAERGNASIEQDQDFLAVPAALTLRWR